MIHFKNAMTLLAADRKGVTALEYAVLAGILVLAIGVGFANFGTGILAKINTALA